MLNKVSCMPKQKGFWWFLPPSPSGAMKVDL
jgi:hypothetical protein